MSNQPSKTPSESSRKSAKVEARIPDELKERAEAKAKSRGWNLASVVRALLEVWVDKDSVSPDQVGNANGRAPRPKKTKKQDSTKE